MSKKVFTLDIDKGYEFKKPLHGSSPTTVREALKWVEDHTPEDEEGGQDLPEIEYLLIYAVRRMVALHKDDKRYSAGKLAERRYATRIDQLERRPPKLAALVDGIHATQDGAPRPKVKKPKVKKAAERKPEDPQPTPPGDAGNPEVAL